jgi:hypothetical protein
MRAAPSADLFDGYAQCINAAKAARAHGKYRPISLRRTTMRRMAPDLPEVVISQTTHIEPVNDSELACPECGAPCAILETLPPTYPGMGLVA